MGPSLVNSVPISILEKVVAFTEARHEVLTGNIANLQVPGYRVRDLSVEQFQEKLRQAIQAHQRPVSPGMARDPAGAMREVDESMKHILFHDGSNVGEEQQVLEITKNQMMHNLAVSILSTQYRMFESAIAERV